jgi:hypothetical protein
MEKVTNFDPFNFVEKEKRNAIKKNRSNAMDRLNNAMKNGRITPIKESRNNNLDRSVDYASAGPLLKALPSNDRKKSVFNAPS